MANFKDLALLRNGYFSKTNLHSQRPEIHPDFSSSELSTHIFNEDIYEGATFESANINFSTFRSCTIVDSKFYHAFLESSHFFDCSLSYSHFFRADLVNSTFENCTLDNVSFVESNLSGCKFIGVEFSGKPSFKNAIINESDISGFMNAGIDVGVMDIRESEGGVSSTLVQNVTESDQDWPGEDEAPLYSEAKSEALRVIHTQKHVARALLDRAETLQTELLLNRSTDKNFFEIVGKAGEELAAFTAGEINPELPGQGHNQPPPDLISVLRKVSHAVTATANAALESQKSYEEKLSELRLRITELERLLADANSRTSGLSAGKQIGIQVVSGIATATMLYAASAVSPILYDAALIGIDQATTTSIYERFFDLAPPATHGSETTFTNL